MSTALSWLQPGSPAGLSSLLELGGEEHQLQVLLRPDGGAVDIAAVRRRGTARTRQGRQRGAMALTHEELDDTLWAGYCATLRARRTAPAPAPQPSPPAKAIHRRRRAERRRLEELEVNAQVAVDLAIRQGVQNWTGALQLALKPSTVATGLCVRLFLPQLPVLRLTFAVLGAGCWVLGVGSYKRERRFVLPTLAPEMAQFLLSKVGPVANSLREFLDALRTLGGGFQPPTGVQVRGVWRGACPVANYEGERVYVLSLAQNSAQVFRFGAAVFSVSRRLLADFVPIRFELVGRTSRRGRGGVGAVIPEPSPPTLPSCRETSRRDLRGAPDA
jgi:hypothetical protein